MTFQEFFNSDYKYRTYERRLGNAQYDYRTLTQKGVDGVELICVVCGANGGVNDAKYKAMVDLIHDRASKGSFASLVSAMYTPYTVERVCKGCHKDKDTINAAIAIVLFFASLKGYLSADDNKMINLIYYGH